MSDAEHFRVALEACQIEARNLRTRAHLAEERLAAEGFAACKVCGGWFRPWGPEGINLKAAVALHYTCVPVALSLIPPDGADLHYILQRDIILARVASGIIRRRWGQIPRDWPEDVRTAVAEKIEALRSEPSTVRED